MGRPSRGSLAPSGVSPLPGSTALEVARKDLAVEARTRDMLALMVMLAALILLLFRVASEGTPVPAGTAIWVAMVFIATAGLARTFHGEVEHGTLDLLLASPAGASALYFGKTIAATVVVLAGGGVTLVFAVAFFGTSFLRDPLVVLAFVALAAPGLAAQASLFSALSARSRARAALFPVLMLPLALPLMYWAARGTVAVTTGAALSDPEVWLNLAFVATYDAIFVPLNSLLSSYALET